jgi:hypothetical protein
MSPPTPLPPEGSLAYLRTHNAGWYLVRVHRALPSGLLLNVAAHMNLASDRGWPYLTPRVELLPEDYGRLCTDVPLPDPPQVIRRIVPRGRPRKRR